MRIVFDVTPIKPIEAFAAGIIVGGLAVLLGLFLTKVAGN